MRSRRPGARVGAEDSEDFIFVLRGDPTAAALQELVGKRGYRTRLINSLADLGRTPGGTCGGVLLVHLHDLSQGALATIRDLQMHGNIHVIGVISHTPRSIATLALIMTLSDFVKMPIDAQELDVRLRRVLSSGPARAIKDEGPANLASGGLPAFPERISYMKRLSPIERNILLLLERQLNTVVEIESLCTLVDGATHQQRVSAVRVHISRLRRKIEPDYRRPEYIINVRSKGYILTRSVKDA